MTNEIKPYPLNVMHIETDKLHNLDMIFMFIVRLIVNST